MKYFCLDGTDLFQDVTEGTLKRFDEYKNVIHMLQPVTRSQARWTAIGVLSFNGQITSNQAILQNLKTPRKQCLFLIRHL